MFRSSRAGLLSHESHVISRSVSPVEGTTRNNLRDIELSELNSSSPSNQRHKRESSGLGTRAESSFNDAGFDNHKYNHVDNNRNTVDSRNLADGNAINNASRPRKIMVSLKENAYSGEGKDGHDMTKNNGTNSSSVSGDISDESENEQHPRLRSNRNQSNGQFTNTWDTQAPSAATDSHFALSPSQSAKTSASFRSSSVELDEYLAPGSRLSVASGLSTGDEEEYEEELNFYCVDHMLLISQTTAQGSHANCSYVLPAHEWAEAQTMERERRNVQDELQRYDKFAARMIDERNEFKETLENEKDDVTDKFIDVMEDVITFLLKKQKEFMGQLDKLHERQVDNINSQIKRCKKVQQETFSHLNKLQECPPGSAEFKKVKKTVQAKCPVYEEILRRDFNASLRIKYEFRQDPWVQNLFDQFTSLGDVKICSRPSKLPGFLSEGKETDFGKRALGAMIHNDATCDDEGNSCCFSGATFISGGRAVIADWSNGCLKIFKGKGVLLYQVPLPNNPWDVKHLGDDRIVVTVPGEQKVYIISVTESGVTLEFDFEADCECWAVVPVGDKLAMTCDPWSKAPSVKVYTETGKLLRFYQKDSRGDFLFSHPEHITTDIHQEVLYVSDGRANTVIALTLEGCVLFRYRNKWLETPTGVTTDNQGYLYVCGKESGNVHQVSKSGELVRILIDQPLLQNPKAIHFDPENDCFLLTDTSDDNCDDFFTVQWE